MNSKWLDMLAGYGSHHQNKINIISHLIGVPIIMLGMFIPMSWVSVEIVGLDISLALAAVAGLTVFYGTLDLISALTFAVLAAAILWLATLVGQSFPAAMAWLLSAVAFFGGYALQFWGHAIEGKKPYLLDYPIQANVSAPLFVVVEAYKMLGLREAMFNAMQERIRAIEANQSA